MYLNLKLFKAIKQHISAEPKRLRMGCYWARPKDKTVSYSTFVGDVKLEPECKTIGCIAGWTLILSGQSLNHNYRQSFIEQLAAQLLVVGDDDTASEWRSYLARVVFHHFPEQDSDEPTPGTRRYARRVIQRINEFIDLAKASSGYQRESKTTMHP